MRKKLTQRRRGAEAQRSKIEIEGVYIQSNTTRALHALSDLLASLRLCVFALTSFLILGIASSLPAQAVKGDVSPDAPPPPLTYRGLVPGLDTLEKVRTTLGKPTFEAFWYSYKLYYDAQGRPGLVDAIHAHGNKPTDKLANIEAASIPEGFATEAEIRGKFGAPEYELRMATWKLLDYSEKGVRFTLTPDGKTTGVAYFPHGNVRVHEGERKLMDISKLREGAQPKPSKAAQHPGLKLGVSEVVITPTEPKWYPRPFKVHDDIKARTAVFADGKTTFALVGADLFGAGWEDMKVIRDKAAEFGVPNVVIGMSHNHAAPDTIGVYGHYPAEHIADLQIRIANGIKEAKDNLKPVQEIRTASKELPMDGARVIGLFRNARNSGIVDPTLSIIQAFGEDDKPIATLVNFACHVESQMMGMASMTADFPGYMCEKMKAEGMGQAVFLNGAVGGMISGDNRERTHESSEAMGLELAKIVGDLAKIAQPPATFEFSAETKRVEIPMSNPKFKPLYSTGLRKLHDGRVVTDMQYFRLGEAQIVTLPGELLPEVSFEILEKMDGFPRILIGLANDELGYMIPPYDFRADYYEETMSQGPATGLIIRDTAIRMIEGIK